MFEKGSNTERIIWERNNLASRRKGFIKLSVWVEYDSRSEAGGVWTDTR